MASLSARTVPHVARPAMRRGPIGHNSAADSKPCYAREVHRSKYHTKKGLPCAALLWPMDPPHIAGLAIRAVYRQSVVVTEYVVTYFA